MKRLPIALLPTLLLATALHANDITISNPTLTGTNTVNATTQVQFDITWENSWRTSSAPNNWDAAWVFVKYRDANTGLWQHARLGDSHLAPVDAIVATGLLDPTLPFDATTNWGVGAFVYRATDGTGTFTGTGTQLQWNYGQNGIAYADIAEVKVFAVEMVYVPQGSFWVGDSGSGSGSFIAGGTTNDPFIITSEAAINVDNTSGSLWGTSTSGNSTIGGSGTLPAAFPKGFAGFFLMKYEITQQHYVDFLNTLTRTQQNTRTGTNLAVGVTSVTNRYVMANGSTLQFRNGIRCNATIDANGPIIFYCDRNGNGTGGEANDGQWVACNWLSWADVAAYLDWSGLRPMSELEYEKACRGPAAPVANEYAWGSTNIVRAEDITFTGAINESTSTVGANAVYSAPLVPGPMRVGVFAAGATTREQSGAGYSGAMELSGNLWERVVTVGNPPGRAFTGTLGNGSLDASGDADAPTWPGTFAQGVGSRGGSVTYPVTVLNVSDRSAGITGTFTRDSGLGGRGVRVFP